MPVLAAKGNFRSFRARLGPSAHLISVCGDDPPGPSGRAPKLARPRPPEANLPDYLPYDQRTPSTAYRDMLAAIRDRGVRVQTKQGEDALALAGHCMRFGMPDGAAVITER